MTIHHKPASARAIEHAKSRDTSAHRLISPGSGAVGHASTRGFATATVVNGKTVRDIPQTNIQPRQGGKPKGYDIAHSWGNTAQQITKENTAHIVTPAVDASSANPLDLMTSAQAGKHPPPCMMHDGMTRQQVAGAHLNGEDILREALENVPKLPPVAQEN